MADPTHLTAVVKFRGYPDQEMYAGLHGEAGLEARIKRALETHPTLSFRIDSVEVTREQEESCESCQQPFTEADIDGGRCTKCGRMITSKERAR